MFMTIVDLTQGQRMVRYGETLEEAKEALFLMVWDWRILEGDTEADIEDSVDEVMEDIEIYEKQFKNVPIDYIFNPSTHYYWKEVKE